MACCERNTRNMLIFVVCLALWDLTDCAVIRTVRLHKRNYDRDWWKEVSLPTLPTFDWDIFTVEPEDRDDKPTPITRKAFDWNRFTLKPFDWDRFTVKPIDWNRITVKPFDWNKHTRNPVDDVSLKLAIFLPLFIGVVIVLVCKYFVCNRENNPETSRPILHPPPRTVTAPPPTNVQFSHQNDTIAFQNLRHEQFSAAATWNSSVTDSSNRNNQTDKPPGYSDVVLADLSGRQTPFREVIPTIPETPPPQYDNRNMRY